MVAEFTRLGIDVEYLFSGRPEDSDFDIEEFTQRRFGTSLKFCDRSGSHPQTENTDEESADSLRSGSLHFA